MPSESSFKKGEHLTIHTPAQNSNAGVIEVNEDLTRNVAYLARLELSDLEIKTFTHQLLDILKYFEQLQEVDIQGVIPMTHPLEGNLILRDDEVKPFDGPLLESAPDVLYNGYKVPSIM